MSEKLHGILKEYIMELGQKVKNSKGQPYYRVYSGDSEPIFIAYGKKYLKYPPDVVYERKGRYSIIEIAFSEDWRSVVGEITLASFVKGLDCLLILTKEWEDEDIRNISLVADKLGVKWCRIKNLDKKETENIETAKSIVRDILKKLELI